MTGSFEVYLDAGDALLFVDSLCHGSAKRTNKGEEELQSTDMDHLGDFFDIHIDLHLSYLID